MRYCIVFIFILCTPVMGGCSKYVAYRAHDAMDIADICVATGIAYGVQARVSFASAGLLWSQEACSYGLRGGEWHWGKVYMGGDIFDPDALEGNADICILLLPGGRYDNRDVSAEKEEWKSLPGYRRSKYYEYWMFGAYLPFAAPPVRSQVSESSFAVAPERYPFYYFTAAQALVGLGKFNIRIGANPGEVVDLLLGLVGIDIFGDDRDVAFGVSGTPQ